MCKERKNIISPFATLSVAVFILIGTVYLFADVSEEFADLINGSISQSFRRIMASFGDLFPFSVFEVFVFSIPIIIISFVYRGITCFSDRTRRIKFVINLFAAVLLIYSGHILSLGIAHQTTPISEKMELCEAEADTADLSDVLTDLRDEINLLSTLVPRNSEGIFESGFSYDELSKIISSEYTELAKSFNLPAGYDSCAKGVKSGALMSYLGITGIYTYPTGEANINTAYPDYVSIFTTAHEMAHQRGIMREDEANFIAYLITSGSDDTRLRYSGALNMYGYFASALYKADSEAYFSVAAGLCDFAKVDIRAANAVSEKYGDTIIENISDLINEIYLESNGSEGIVSYSRVVELVLAYRKAGK